MIKEFGNTGECYEGDILHRLGMALNHIQYTQAKAEKETPGSSVSIHRLTMEVFPKSDSESVREYKTSVWLEI